LQFIIPGAFGCCFFSLLAAGSFLRFSCFIEANLNRIIKDESIHGYHVDQYKRQKQNASRNMLQLPFVSFVGVVIFRLNLLLTF